MNKKKVIIDCDPGIDDSLAIMLALSSKEIEVVGITIVSGNVINEKGYKNALKVLKLMDRLDVPVYMGEAYPRKRELITAEDTHGEDGLGETNIPEIDLEVKRGAVDFILKVASQEELSIIALGPFMNLAKALEKDKDTFHKIKEIVSMGGAFKSFGNCSQVAEFNYWVDPDSVEYVLHNSKVPLTMVTLDVTREIVLTPNLREMIKQFHDEKGDFIHDITRFYVDFHWKQERTLGCVINDPLAVAYFIDRTLCSGSEYYVDIVTEGKAIGGLLVDEGDFYRKNSNCLVLTKVDSKRFMQMFLKRIFKNNEKDIDIVLNNEKYGLF
ncbi:MAG: nucleoside hydrolase [Inconstantimicrobium porci]|uniref:Nucleoside hydrolase n=1 Tax=Inconstantimicrobium porci TaxID=2652291 RepID=A0A7X2MY18_9CLOT|nr:nucleoside hydrolase [Inconstantimicrobium porci]MDD6771182.1 nucleoside hydrolase [Inconstantimicrobium porci]MDY5912153.1 nucleoside hydrolase [Inconstantimicrobium porci]MSR91150.1 nucleoside hydrolase [Inconstantimicrobium porci]